MRRVAVLTVTALSAVTIACAQNWFASEAKTVSWQVGQFTIRVPVDAGSRGRASMSAPSSPSPNGRFQVLGMAGPDSGSMPPWLSYSRAAQMVDFFLIHSFDQFNAPEMKRHMRDQDPNHTCIILRYETSHRFSNDGTVSYVGALRQRHYRLVNSLGNIVTSGKGTDPSPGRGDSPLDISNSAVLTIVQNGILSDLNSTPGSVDGMYNDGEWMGSIDPRWAQYFKNEAPSQTQVSAWPALSINSTQQLHVFLKNHRYPWFIANTMTVYAGFPADDGTDGPTTADLRTVMDGAAMEFGFHHYRSPAAKASYPDRILQKQIAAINDRINRGKYVWVLTEFDGKRSTDQERMKLLAWAYGLSQVLHDGRHFIFQFKGMFVQTEMNYMLQNVGQPVAGQEGARGNRDANGNYNRLFTHAHFIVNDSLGYTRGGIPPMSAENTFF